MVQGRVGRDEDYVQGVPFLQDTCVLRYSLPLRRVLGTTPHPSLTTPTGPVGDLDPSSLGATQRPQVKTSSYKDTLPTQVCRDPDLRPKRDRRVRHLGPVRELSKTWVKGIIDTLPLF